jgi:hypothetical protein
VSWNTTLYARMHSDEQVAQIAASRTLMRGENAADVDQRPSGVRRPNHLSLTSS